MKRVLIFSVFGPLIGSAAISLSFIVLQFFSTKNSIVNGYEFAFDYFFMSVLTGFAYVYGFFPAILTGILSIWYKNFNLKDVAILLIFSVSMTCLIHYFMLRTKMDALLELSVLPSLVSTLALSYLLRTNKLRKEI